MAVRFRRPAKALPRLPCRARAAILRAMQARDVIQLLDLARHPEGGWYRETWRAPLPEGAAAGAAERRAAGTAIYYLLGMPARRCR
jgi:Cupin superfamily (DUF985)